MEYRGESQGELGMIQRERVKRRKSETVVAGARVAVKNHGIMVRSNARLNQTGGCSLGLRGVERGWGVGGMGKEAKRRVTR